MAPETIPAWQSDAGWKEVLDSLENGEYPRGWEDIDPESRELALMESGFTGLANEGAEDIMSETSKDQMESLLVDTLINQWTGYDVDPDIMITIGYKDGRRLTNEEIEPVKKVTANQSFATQRKIFRQTALGKNVDFAVISGPWGTNYWVSGTGIEPLKEYTGYERWKKGRGEKRRDYIQDDWI